MELVRELVLVNSKLNMIELLSKTSQCKILEEGLMRYNEHAIGEQAQIGRQLVVDNAKLMTAATAMSKVIINKDKENEKLTMERKGI